MTRTKVWIGAALLALALAGCDVGRGAACDQVGSQHTNKDGKLYTCAKNERTGKGYWYEGKP